jgi:3',5'-cyclic AMP phosphodiesterase CpdA
MTRIAHLSDLHLLESEHQQRDAAGRFRLTFLSFFRKLDQEERRARVRRALAAYAASGAEHLVVTGDLTEDGTEPQFEVLAEVLLESGIDPREITLTAGNHDAYTDAKAFERALEGPLRPFAATSRPGTISVIDDVIVVPISTVIRQAISRSAGAIPNAHLDWVHHVAVAFKGSGRAIAIAQHHQPLPYAVAPINWIDGLQNHASALDLLQRHRELHVLHGHRHRSSDRPVSADGPARVFGTTACVDHASPLRLYESHDGRLWPIEKPLQPAQEKPVWSGPALAAGA